MGNIFLSGGGNEKQTKILDKAFAENLPKTKKILYIPIAMPKTEFTPKNCFKWVSNALNPLGILNIDMWTKVNNKKFSELKEYDAIYIGGGNTFSLLDKLRKSSFDNLLKKYIQQGGIIYGGSAGAIVLGEDIQTAGFGGDADKNLIRLKKFDGLKLIKDYSIQCHYSSKDEEETKKYVKEKGFPVIALPEETGLFIKKGLVKVIGFKDAVIFKKNSKEIIKKGSTFKL